MASAIIHVSELPTTLASALAHIKQKNKDKDILLKLLIPGIIGGVIGIWFLSDFGDIIEPYINIYLIIMGIIIIYKALRKQVKKTIGNLIYGVGLAGGFLMPVVVAVVVQSLLGQWLLMEVM